MKNSRIVVLVALCVVAAAGQSRANLTEEFNASNGGFAVVSTPVGFAGAWQWAAGSWQTNGVTSPVGPFSSALNGPVWTLAENGLVSMAFDHRYSFEYDGTLWDGGQVRLSLNGGAYVPVPLANFTANGYTGVIQGNNVLFGQSAFNGNSPGYGSGALITSQLTLGTFSAGDQISVQFLAAWDEYARGSVPNWQIDRLDIIEPEGCAVVPVPGALLLAGLGAAVVGYLRRRRAF